MASHGRQKKVACRGGRDSTPFPNNHSSCSSLQLPTLEQLHQASARQEGVKKPDSRFLSENHYMQGAVSTPLLLWSTCGQQASVRTSL